MNERIRELAEQIVGPSRLHGGQFALMGNEQIEKFAELIVKECEVAMCEMPRYAKTKPFQEMENATIEDCIRTIKEHFGVEE